jgi:hypothetical protein
MGTTVTSKRPDGQIIARLPWRAGPKSTSRQLFALNVRESRFLDLAWVLELGYFGLT